MKCGFLEVLYGSYPAIGDNLSALRRGQRRNDADRCMPVLLRMHCVPYRAAPEVGRLLRVLFIWYHAVPAGSITAGMLYALTHYDSSRNSNS
jgi:hypothetical protein